MGDNERIHIFSYVIQCPYTTTGKRCDSCVINNHKLLKTTKSSKEAYEVIMRMNDMEVQDIIDRHDECTNRLK